MMHICGIQMSHGNLFKYYGVGVVDRKPFIRLNNLLHRNGHYASFIFLLKIPLVWKNAVRRLMAII